MAQQALTFRPLYLAYTQDAHLFFTSHAPDKLLHFPQSPVNPWLSLHSSPQRKLTARKIHCFSTCKGGGHACCFSTPWDWIPTSSGFYSCRAPLKFLLTYTFSLEMRTDPHWGDGLQMSADGALQTLSWWNVSRKRSNWDVVPQAPCPSQAPGQWHLWPSFMTCHTGWNVSVLFVAQQWIILGDDENLSLSNFSNSWAGSPGVWDQEENRRWAGFCFHRTFAAVSAFWKNSGFFKKEKLAELWKRGFDVTKVTKPEECEHHNLIDL